MYTNTAVLDYANLIELPQDVAMNDLMPHANVRLPAVSELVSKLLKTKDLLLPNKVNQMSKKEAGLSKALPQIPPYIRHDGTLFLAEAFLNNDQCESIKLFLQEYQSRLAIKKVVFNCIELPQDSMIDFFSICFQKKEKGLPSPDSNHSRSYSAGSR